MREQGMQPGDYVGPYQRVAEMESYRNASRLSTPSLLKQKYTENITRHIIKED